MQECPPSSRTAGGGKRGCAVWLGYGILGLAATGNEEGGREEGEGKGGFGNNGDDGADGVDVGADGVAGLAAFGGVVGEADEVEGGVEGDGGGGKERIDVDAAGGARDFADGEEGDAIDGDFDEGVFDLRADFEDVEVKGSVTGGDQCVVGESEGDSATVA